MKTHFLHATNYTTDLIDGICLKGNYIPVQYLHVCKNQHVVISGRVFGGLCYLTYPIHEKYTLL